MADETGICNLALAHLGQNRIMALSDDSPAARACLTYYAQTRDEVLQSHPWTFAVTRANLSRLTDTPISEWAYQYQLPSDFIRVLQMNGFGWWQAQGQWQVEGRVLLTNAAEASIRYVKRVTDGTQFPPLFAEAVSVKLAARLAKPLAGDMNAAQALLQTYERLTGPQARRMDAFEGNPPIVPPYANSQFVRARGGGSGATNSNANFPE